MNKNQTFDFNYDVTHWKRGLLLSELKRGKVFRLQDADLEWFRNDEEIVLAVFKNAERIEDFELRTISAGLLNDRNFLLKFLQETDVSFTGLQKKSTDGQLNIFHHVTNKSILLDKDFIKQVILLTGKSALLRYIHPMLATDKELFSFMLSHVIQSHDRAFAFMDLKYLRFDLLDDEDMVNEVIQRRCGIQNDISLLRKLYEGGFGQKDCLRNYVAIKSNSYVPLETINKFESDLTVNPLSKDFYFNQIDDVANLFKAINKIHLISQDDPMDTACHFFRYLDNKDLEQIKKTYSVEEYSDFSSFVTIEQTKRLQKSLNQMVSKKDNRKYKISKIA